MISHRGDPRILAMGVLNKECVRKRAQKFLYATPTSCTTCTTTNFSVLSDIAAQLIILIYYLSL